VGRVIDTIDRKTDRTGGMGEVYLAHDDSWTERSPSRSCRTNSVETRADRTLRSRGPGHFSLNHPNIVTIYDVGTFDDQLYRAEFVEGQTLREKIGGDLRLKDIFAVGIQLCDALSAAHRAASIHRDIKPENINLAAGRLRQDPRFRAGET